MSFMTPSMTGMTDGQIDKVVDIFRARLRKSRTILPSDAVQRVLGQSELSDEMFWVFQKHVEAVSPIIIRRVKVDRTRSPEQVIEATGRKKHTDKWVVGSMPCGTGEEVNVGFLKLESYYSDDDLDKMLDSLGLRPADPYSLAKVSEDDPSFADRHPNFTHWQDANGNWCFAAFAKNDAVRLVGVNRGKSSWGISWWVAVEVK